MISQIFNIYPHNQTNNGLSLAIHLLDFIYNYLES